MLDALTITAELLAIVLVAVLFWAAVL